MWRPSSFAGSLAVVVAALAFGAGCGGKTVDITVNLNSVASLGPEQTHNAAVVISVGQQMLCATEESS